MRYRKRQCRPGRAAGSLELGRSGLAGTGPAPAGTEVPGYWDGPDSGSPGQKVPESWGSRDRGVLGAGDPRSRGIPGA